ncbi:hypothetical protein D9611_005685 [Ephemerocybe angulata]|uniref:NAD-dependent epimerase/dehydratase domain-containing protein n=1 Tax=Ephemerocybe angulata TaxID=980116 RepID=A0A8H5F4B1_9AGAR|nr:hypothetical protein D9611_005685 [Tulosesus angulatus]
MSQQKIVVCGAGFLGKHIARNLASPYKKTGDRIVQISSRNPEPLLRTLGRDLPEVSSKLRAVPLDITKPATLAPAFEGAHTVISLVGVLHGTPSHFEAVQWRGAENVAKAAKEAGARLIHFSAIGADPSSDIPYAWSKGLGEAGVRSVHPDATIIRPSLVFGPEDEFFNRLAKLSKYLPFLPVFGGGLSKFQPIYVDDIARAVEVMCRCDPEVEQLVSGKIMEAGGPRVLTYRELMETVLKYTYRRRPIVSLPFWVGMLQASMLERLPNNLFTITRDQVKQLRLDNVVNTNFGPNEISFEIFLRKRCFQGLTPLYGILPAYLE